MPTPPNNSQSGPKDGGPAFPAHDFVDGIANSSMHGMTLRDWFAGKALQGYVMTHIANNSTPVPNLCAELAYELADAMIAERNKRL